MSIPNTILITGAASGLGHGFLAYYCQQPDTQVFAVDINEIKTPPASNLLDHTSNDQPSNIKTFQTDITSEASVAALAQALQQQPLNLIIHCAGARGLVSHLEQRHPNNVAACETLPAMDLATLQRTFTLNAAGTFLVLRALLPNLALVAGSGRRPQVIVMASRMGSLALNARDRHPAAGGAYAYRASKAAQHAVVRSLAVDVPEVRFVLCHPGRVATGLVRCREEGAVDVSEAVADVVKLIEGRSQGDCVSGGFSDRFGNSIEW